MTVTPYTVTAANVGNDADEATAYGMGCTFVIRTDLVLPPPLPPPTYEDLTTYTKVDPTSLLAATAAQVSASSLGRNVSAYVYKDFGAAHFGNFSIDFQYSSSNYSGGYNVGVIALGNAVADMEATRLASGNEQCVIATTSGALSLHEICAGAEYNSSAFSTALNTTYYCSLSRDISVGTYGTLTLKVYSDSARTILLSTLTLALHSAVNFRYLFPVQSVNSGQSYWLNAVIGNVAVH